jgi:hypothetical protein
MNATTFVAVVTEAPILSLDDARVSERDDALVSERLLRSRRARW